MFRPRRQHGNFTLFLLIMHVAKIGLNNIPPITFAVFLICTFIHYNFLNMNIPSVSKVCVLPYSIYYSKQWSRLITHAFVHGSDHHLYYNMVSWLWKGRILEPRLKSTRFGVIVLLFMLISSTLMTIFSFILGGTFITTCSIGISGVLFGLKVILTSQHQDNANTNFMGIMNIPSKWSYWVELVVIQLIYPNASLLGHFCGILAGLLYVYGYLEFIINPIVYILDGFVSVLPIEENFNQNNPRYNNNFNFNRHYHDNQQNRYYRHYRYPDDDNFY